MQQLTRQGGVAAARAATHLLLGQPCSTRQWAGLRLLYTLAGNQSDVSCLLIHVPGMPLKAHIADGSTVCAEHYPVAICGGGPAGLTLSALLAKFGVPSILFERSITMPQHPQVGSRLGLGVFAAPGP